MGKDKNNLESCIKDSREVLVDTSQLWYLHQLKITKSININNKEYDYIVNEYLDKHKISTMQLVNNFYKVNKLYNLNPFTISFNDNYGKVLQGAFKSQIDIFEDTLENQFRDTDNVSDKDLYNNLLRLSKSKFKVERIPAKRVIKRYDIKNGL